MVKLTSNEKKTLKFLLKNGRITDTDIAEKLKITKQAVGKIRKKLEDNGIIKGYVPEIDYGKMGITTFAVSILQFKTKAWEDFGEFGIEEKLINTPNIISVFRVPEGSSTHIALYGFKDFSELVRFFHVMKTANSLNQYIELQKIYTFSNHSFIKNSPTKLFMKIIDDMGKDKSLLPLSIREIDDFNENIKNSL